MNRHHPLDSPPVSAYLLHPFQFAFAGLFMLTAVQLALSGWQLATIPPPLVAAWTVMLLVAGVGMVVGPMWTTGGARARAIEKGALYIASATWAAIILSLLLIPHPPLVAPVFQGFFVLIGTFGRVIALRRAERALEHVFEVARHANGG